jgi:hypothetical protein
VPGRNSSTSQNRFEKEPSSTLPGQGAAKATTAGSFVTTTAVSACLAKMLDASETHCSRLMACWNGASGQQELFGTDQRGQPFGSTMLDGMAGEAARVTIATASIPAASSAL